MQFAQVFRSGFRCENWVVAFVDIAADIKTVHAPSGIHELPEPFGADPRTRLWIEGRLDDSQILHLKRNILVVELLFEQGKIKLT